MRCALLQAPALPRPLSICHRHPQHQFLRHLSRYIKTRPILDSKPGRERQNVKHLCASSYTASQRVSAANVGSLGPRDLLTVEEARHTAEARGLFLEVKPYGPVYFLTCRDGGPDGEQVATSSGFTAAPFGLMHCDSLKVDTGKLSARGGCSGKQRGVGLGLLMCGAVIALGREAGCRTAEILAINDDDVAHRRLCKYYRRMGFETVVEVGGRGLRDVPHLLVWGGIGTRMDVDTTAFLARWSGPIRDRK